MFGTSDPCFAAYTDCTRNSGTGFISTLSYTNLTLYNTPQSNPPGVCSSICYTCAGVLPDTAPSTTWTSPDAKCETLQYACNQGCSGGRGVVPLCLPNYSSTSRQIGSVGTCLCESLGIPQINLKQPQGLLDIHICASGGSSSSNNAYDRPNQLWLGIGIAATILLLLF
ncbi:hypothetical protein BASA50_002939 [Batrachochytrium salamandrivorans]|uniref:Uncharacterized protein n=1 Tax=Batrachochytrium salamandrivorans TaxID=1357716 RepID=A0ABQ8FJZ7_9FUNG|nr:hypothetical protein BASA50_002939 [Batrachochytrium salamandrivorans]